MKKKRVHASSVLKQSGHRQNRGFTLLEALIGMFILLTFVMMTNAYMAAYIKTTASVKQLSRATTVGNDMIEKIRSSAYDKIENGKDTVENNYIRTWVLDPANTDGNKKCINLTVRWPMATKKHSLHLSTIIAK
jgi:prepilin-type N-terminal cleavage/methylation domain-containing protein